MGKGLMFLLDTHVVVWSALEPDKLSKKAVVAIEDARNTDRPLFISDITLFEVANLIRRQRVVIQISLDSFLEELESWLVVVSINRQIASLSVQLPDTYPSDPMDRLIGATAMVKGLPLITADERIRKSKVLETIW
ncbi:MAG TPA: type II toxin-antitoxin system VapC family toxin [Terriglobales bacterium]|nr:type II toxin-antitoxin system VapC family toxin [Terriglobales bacterium]